MIFDNIAAIATAAGNSGISIIRISGNDAVSIADRVYKSVSGNLSLKDVKSHTVHYGYIFDGEEKIDEVLVSVFLAPKSFTAENVVEISCHGGSFVTKKILDTVLKNGARCAEPGEFTKRAFLNGRIDLSQAESVIDIINSKNEYALKNSLSQLDGSILNKIKEIREIIIHEVAFLESAIDDPEHYSLDGYYEVLSNKINDIHSLLELILKNSDNGRIISEGINTLIIGKPNAGKSSLLNRLSGNERAIVTEIAGTTRDIIEERINISGLTLNLIDTAGIRETDDIVEKIGVDRAISFIDKADLIMYVADSSVELNDNDEKIIEMIKDKNAIILLNKSDLDCVTDEKKINSLIDKKIISVSASTGEGIDELSEYICDIFLKGKIKFDEDIYITNARQKSEIQTALSHVNLLKQSIMDEMPEDFLTIDMMSAYSALGRVIGEETEDDLVNRIFSEFCMGK